MNLLRTAVLIAGTVLLAGGYLASQYAFFTGTTAKYAQAIDTQPVRLLSLVLLMVCVVLAFTRQQVNDE